MNINNIRIIKQNIIPLLFVPIILSGCGKKSDCSMPNRHIHLYKKTISVNDPNNPNDDIAINRYIYGENLSFFNYKQTPNAININKDDEKYIDLIAKKELFLGSDNWNYLYDVMQKNSKDHLEYYYDYKEKKTYYEEDDDGKRTKKVKYIRHTGWSTNPYQEGNTGEIAYVHTMYFGYAIEEKNGKRKVIKSGLCEDMREIIKKYPYFSENPTEIRTVTLYFPEYRIPDVTLEDFGNPFGHPDLEHKKLDEEYIKKPIIFIK